MATALDTFRDALRGGMAELSLSSDADVARSLRDALSGPHCNANVTTFAGIALALLGDPSSVGRALEAMAESPEVATHKPAAAFVGSVPLLIPYPRELDLRRDGGLILAWYRENARRLRWDAGAGVFALAAGCERSRVLIEGRHDAMPCSRVLRRRDNGWPISGRAGTGAAFEQREAHPPAPRR